MEYTIHEQNGVIVCRFSGEVRLEDMIESWNSVFATYTNLKDYKGIVNIYLDAEVKHEDNNLNVIVEYLKGYLDHLRDLKIAIVMDTPMVTSTIIIGQRMKRLQIKPFATEKAALEWVRL
ncbi:MAG: STAS/SEC14 domain-containing protein [Bacteroidales bacterium]|nr:STAS/SEC14 domain-containing protein [Bacteroidales bacterium]